MGNLHKAGEKFKMPIFQVILRCCLSFRLEETGGENSSSGERESVCVLVGSAIEIPG